MDLTSIRSFADISGFPSKNWDKLLYFLLPKNGHASLEGLRSLVNIAQRRKAKLKNYE
jgi:hypothetical protein